MNESNCSFPTLTNKFLRISNANASKIKHFKFPKVIGTYVTVN
jgi:hypothetical protein